VAIIFFICGWRIQTDKVIPGVFVTFQGEPRLAALYMNGYFVLAYWRPNSTGWFDYVIGYNPTTGKLETQVPK
jgi:hypothetical protein